MEEKTTSGRSSGAERAVRHDGRDPRADGQSTSIPSAALSETAGRGSISSKNTGDHASRASRGGG